MNAYNPPPHLPTIDSSGLHGAIDERARFAAKLRRNIHEHGFFYAAGHGGGRAPMEHAGAMSKGVFALQAADKLAIEVVKSLSFRRHNRAGLARHDATVPVIELPPIGAESGVTTKRLNPILRDVGHNLRNRSLRPHPVRAQAHCADGL